MQIINEKTSFVEIIVYNILILRNPIANSSEAAPNIVITN